MAVNLEVARGRSARGAEASAIAPFAATASAQLEVASAATEALLGFARAEPEPADVAVILGRLGRLLALGGQGVAMTGTEGAAVAPTSAPTTAPPELVRAVVARSVLSAMHVGGPVPCEISSRNGIFLRVTGGDASAPSLDPELVTVASAWGIQIVTHGHTLELSFPSLATDVTPHAPA